MEVCGNVNLAFAKGLSDALRTESELAAEHGRLVGNGEYTDGVQTIHSLCRGFNGRCHMQALPRSFWVFGSA